MSLSILIVNWRSKDYLRACLRSIVRECSEVSPQVVVVDGGSFDGCDGMIAAEFPAVEFVQSSENLGFGRCNNLGFKRCRGRFVLLLNPDTELRPGSVQRLVEGLKTLPSAGIVAPCLLNTDGSVQISCVQALPTPWNQALDFDILRRCFPDASVWGTEALHRCNPTKVEAVSGACLLIAADLFRTVKGFGEQYFMYGEDMDLCWRVGRAGYGIYHLPDACVVHHGGGSSHGSFSRISAVLMRESTNRFIRCSQGRGAAALHRTLMLMSAVLRLFALVPLWIFASGKHRRRVRDAARKWSVILRWSLGLEKIPTPSGA